MTQPAPPGTCFDCLYWQPVEVGGYCHYNAPPISLDLSLSGRVIWPRTLPTDWCGKWAQATATRTAQVVDG